MSLPPKNRSPGEAMTRSASRTTRASLLPGDTALRVAAGPHRPTRRGRGEGCSNGISPQTLKHLRPMTTPRLLVYPGPASHHQKPDE